MTTPVLEPVHVGVSDARCVMRNPADHACGRWAAVIATLGCVHEHVSDEPICQWCVPLLALDTTICRDCQTCSEPHSCEIQVIRLVDLEDLPAPTPTENP